MDVLLFVFVVWVLVRSVEFACVDCLVGCFVGVGVYLDDLFVLVLLDCVLVLWIDLGLLGWVFVSCFVVLILLVIVIGGLLLVFNIVV